MGTGGFEVVGGLNVAHDAEVAGEDQQREGGEGVLVKNADLAEAEEPEDEVEFVAGSVVYSTAVAKGAGEVGGDFGLS